MILADHEIKKLSENDSLIKPFDDKCLRKSSYDLTVGNEYYIGDHEVKGPIETKRLRKDQTFSIPPHAVAFIICEEKINLNNCLSAKVSLRMAHIYKGAILTTQPPFDPGYSGKVILLIHNLSSEAIYFHRGERIATIEFYKLSSTPDSDKKQDFVISIEKQLKRPLFSSLDSISKTAKDSLGKIDGFITKSSVLGYTVVGVLIAFLGVVITLMGLPAWKNTNTIEDELNKQKKIIEMQAELIKQQADSIVYLKGEGVVLKESVNDLNNALNGVKAELEKK